MEGLQAPRLGNSMIQRYFLLLFLLPLYLWSSDQSFPFHEGEELHYRVKWGIFTVGSAKLHVHPQAQVDGELAHHFSFEVTTNNFADKFYKVRTRIDGYVNQDMTKSVLYKKRQEEGKTNRDITVTFDWKANQIQYKNWDDLRAPITVNQPVFDPLSMLYAFRVLPLEANSIVPMMATDGKKIVDSSIHILKKEKLKVPAGKFSTVLVEPDIKDLGGVFKKSKNANMKIWLEAEHYHYPVKLKSKVRVGSFQAILTKAILPQKS